MKKNKNGLPIEVKYCKKCNLSNQQPTSINEYFHTSETVQSTVKFDENGNIEGDPSKCSFTSHSS